MAISRAFPSRSTGLPSRKIAFGPSSGGTWRIPFLVRGRSCLLEWVWVPEPSENIKKLMSRDGSGCKAESNTEPSLAPQAPPFLALTENSSAIRVDALRVLVPGRRIEADEEKVRPSLRPSTNRNGRSQPTSPEYQRRTQRRRSRPPRRRRAGLIPPAPAHPLAMSSMLETPHNGGSGISTSRSSHLRLDPGHRSWLFFSWNPQADPRRHPTGMRRLPALFPLWPANPFDTTLPRITLTAPRREDFLSSRQVEGGPGSTPRGSMRARTPGIAIFVRMVCLPSAEPPAGPDRPSDRRPHALVFCSRDGLTPSPGLESVHGDRRGLHG
jgi:hypothetical protein